MVAQEAAETMAAPPGDAPQDGVIAPPVAKVRGRGWGGEGRGGWGGAGWDGQSRGGVGWAAWGRVRIGEGGTGDTLVGGPSSKLVGGVVGVQGRWGGASQAGPIAKVSGQGWVGQRNREHW